MNSGCGKVALNDSYICSNPEDPRCEGFNFAMLWEYTQQIQKACPVDLRLYGISMGPATPENASLTQDSCVAAASPSWTYYPGSDIWSRVAT